MNPGIPHGLTLNSHAVGCGFVPDQFLIEVNGAFQMVISG